MKYDRRCLNASISISISTSISIDNGKCKCKCLLLLDHIRSPSIRDTGAKPKRTAATMFIHREMDAFDFALFIYAYASSYSISIAQPVPSVACGICGMWPVECQLESFITSARSKTHLQCDTHTQGVRVRIFTKNQSLFIHHLKWFFMSYVSLQVARAGCGQTFTLHRYFHSHSLVLFSLPI